MKYEEGNGICFSGQMKFDRISNFSRNAQRNLKEILKLKVSTVKDVLLGRYSDEKIIFRKTKLIFGFQNGV